MLSEDVSKDAGIDASRRGFLLGGGLLAAAGLASPFLAKSALAMPAESAYPLSFRNIHTGDSFSGVYRVGDKYLPEAFDQINYVLRDFRTGDIFPIDPALMDILYVTHYKTGSRYPFEVLSGYRSPKTNAMLRRVSNGVAKNSFHMSGRAIDIRLPYYSTAGLRRVAVNLKAGGVGYYPKSNFVHLDTGYARVW